MITPIFVSLNLQDLSHYLDSIINMNRFSPCCTYVLVLAQKQVLEGVFEGGVAQGVAGRVDGAVDVAEPVADGPEGVWDADGAEGVDQDHHVVRRPCDDKSNQDGHDGACHLFLPGRNALPLPLCYSSLLRNL